jgi:sugar phosphate permease
MIWALGANYFCMKLTRYSLLFWLPYYFETALHYSPGKAGYMSTSFEAGGIIGVIGAGLLADRVFGRRRVMVAAFMTAFLAAALGLYGAVGSDSTAINFFTMMLVGACLFGPDSLVAGAVAQDVGGPRAAGLAAGMVNGMGSMGAILQAFVTVEISKAFGWDALFIVFQLLAVIATLALLPFIFRRPKRRADSEAT